jgi:hypothetical protein
VKAERPSCHGSRGGALVKDYAVNAVFEDHFMEVNQKAERFAQEFHVAEQLSLVDWEDAFDGLHLDDQTIVYQAVEPQRLFEDEPFVFYGNGQLIPGWDIAQLTFAANAFAINRFQ